MLIVYSGTDEVLICAPAREASMLVDWFEKGVGHQTTLTERSVLATSYQSALKCGWT